MEVKFVELRSETYPIFQNSGDSKLGRSLSFGGVHHEVPTATIVVKQAIPRAALPLSWLDLSNPGDGTTTSGPRLFSSHSAALEKLFDESPADLSVLLAKDKIADKCCAIERVKKGTYALCWLGSWVKQADLDKTVKTTEISGSILKRKSDEPSEHWWSRAALPSATVNQLSQPTKRVKLDLSRPPFSLNQKHVPSAAPPVKSVQTESHPLDHPEQETTQPIVVEDQLFENLVCQYLDTLYLSRTSLAFFAKGPLSRIRTTFTNTANNHLSIQDLTAFLRTMVLTTSAIDKKFKIKLPELARNFALDFSDDEGTANEKKGRKRAAKKKKLKLGKDGVYPFELEYIKKWWKNDIESQTRPDESGEQRVKRRVTDLLIRETLIQIILILEILALESSTEWKEAQKSREAQVDQPQVDKSENNQTKKRSKKPENLDKTFHILVDKLAIRQSVEHDPQELSLVTEPEKDSTQIGNKDRLSGFCVEVVIPL
jgi:DNA replication regulator SLD3